MSDAVLVLNAGSSSLKFSLFALGGGTPALEVKGQIEGLDTAPRFSAWSAQGATIAGREWPAGTPLGHEGAMAHVLAFLHADLAQSRLVAAGHRVVHGGTRFDAPVVVDAGILEALAALIPLAPLHQPHNLAPIRSLLALAPDLPQVACFDTAFHRGMPELAQAYALPRAITDAGVRRYGFHGLSYEYIASVLPSYDPEAARGRVVVAHLGNGASMCALRAGRSMASTMGFTALEGLPMGTRCGSLDPGIVLYLMRELAMTPQAIEALLYNQSGLLGVSGLSSDMRTLLASEAPRARFAVELFAYRVARELGSLAAAIEGLDALVFTGGIGEHAAPVREAVLRHARWLGLELDPTANRSNGPCISPPARRPRAWVIPTDEELMIARHTLARVAAH